MPRPQKRDRLQDFALAFVANGGNGADAARKAGYSPKGASVAANRLLRNAKVLAAIESEQAKLREKYRLTTKNTLRSLEQAMFFDPRKLFDEKGNAKSIHELDEDTAMALQGFEMGMELDAKGKPVPYLKRVRWLDRNIARDQANKILGNYKAEIPPVGGNPIANSLDRMTEHSKVMQAKFAAVAAAISGAKK